METSTKLKQLEINIDMYRFQEMVIDTLIQELGKDYHIEKSDISKNNGVVYHGINIAQGQSRVGVNIYLDEYLRQHQNGKNYMEIVREIIVKESLYGSKNNDIEEKTKCLKDYNSVKKKINCRLVNTKANIELLQEIPYVPFLDLSIIFYVAVTEPSGSNGEFGSATISNEMMRRWKKNKEALLEAAMENIDVEIEEISSVVKTTLIQSGNLDKLAEFEEMEQKSKEEGLPQMLVVSNKTKCYGACNLLHKKKLYNIAKQLNSNLFILPSSIHEIILMPDEGVSKDKAMELSYMVKEINATQLLKEEILSNSIYYFNRKTKEVTLLIQGTDI